MVFLCCRIASRECCTKVKSVYSPLNCATFVREIKLWLRSRDEYASLFFFCLFFLLTLNGKYLFAETVLWGWRTISLMKIKLVIVGGNLISESHQDEILQAVAIPYSTFRNPALCSKKSMLATLSEIYRIKHFGAWVHPPAVCDQASHTLLVCVWLAVCCCSYVHLKFMQHLERLENELSSVGWGHSCEILQLASGDVKILKILDKIIQYTSKKKKN